MDVYYTRCLIEGNPCLVAFVNESANNVDGGVVRDRQGIRK